MLWRRQGYELSNAGGENQKYFDIPQTLLCLYMWVQSYQPINKKVEFDPLFDAWPGNLKDPLEARYKHEHYVIKFIVWELFFIRKQIPKRFAPNKMNTEILLDL